MPPIITPQQAPSPQLSANQQMFFSSMDKLLELSKMVYSGKQEAKKEKQGQALAVSLTKQWPGIFRGMDKEAISGAYKDDPNKFFDTVSRMVDTDTSNKIKKDISDNTNAVRSLGLHLKDQDMKNKYKSLPPVMQFRFSNGGKGWDNSSEAQRVLDASQAELARLGLKGVVVRKDDPGWFGTSVGGAKKLHISVEPIDFNIFDSGGGNSDNANPSQDPLQALIEETKASGGLQ